MKQRRPAPLPSRLTESYTVYDLGGTYLYRVRWHEDYGWSLQRRARPTDPKHRFNLWVGPLVQNYIQLETFEPAFHARPIKKFMTLVEVEAVIVDSTK